jgi:hypothetical protein
MNNINIGGGKFCRESHVTGESNTMSYKSKLDIKKINTDSQIKRKNLPYNQSVLSGEAILSKVASSDGSDGVASITDSEMSKSESESDTISFTDYIKAKSTSSSPTKVDSFVKAPIVFSLRGASLSEVEEEQDSCSHSKGNTST